MGRMIPSKGYVNSTGSSVLPNLGYTNPIPPVDMVSEAITIGSGYTAKDAVYEGITPSVGYTLMEPTKIVSAIRASLGDYTTISAWELDIPADLTAVNEQWVAECYDDWVGGLDDSVVIADRTTDSTRNIVLTVADGEQHNGVDYSTGFYIETDARTVIQFLPDYTVIDGMAINIIYSSYGPAGILTSGDNSISPIIRNNLIHSQFDAVGNPISIYVATSDYAAIYNNVVIDHSTTPAGFGFYVDCYSADVYNNTAVNLDRGLSVYGGSIVNNISYGCTTDYNFSGFNSNSATNASDKSTATDASVTVLNLTDSDFRDVSNNDYRISFDSDLVDAGTDLSADFTTDIVGTERS